MTGSSAEYADGEPGDDHDEQDDDGEQDEHHGHVPIVGG